MCVGLDKEQHHCAAFSKYIHPFQSVPTHGHCSAEAFSEHSLLKIFVSHSRCEAVSTCS